MLRKPRKHLLAQGRLVIKLIITEPSQLARPPQACQKFVVFTMAKKAICGAGTEPANSRVPAEPPLVPRFRPIEIVLPGRRPPSPLDG
jgi:hypothetical protein